MTARYGTTSNDWLFSIHGAEWRAKRANRETGAGHYIYRDCYGEWTYSRLPITDDRRETAIVIN